MYFFPMLIFHLESQILFHATHSPLMALPNPALLTTPVVFAIIFIHILMSTHHKLLQVHGKLHMSVPLNCKFCFKCSSFSYQLKQQSLKSQIVIATPKLSPFLISNYTIFTPVTVMAIRSAIYKMPSMYQAMCNILYKSSQLSSQQSPEALLILLSQLFLYVFTF